MVGSRAVPQRFGTLLLESAGSENGVAGNWGVDSVRLFWQSTNLI